MELKRISYFKVIHVISVVVSLVYLLKYNFEYQVTEYNTVIVPLWLALLILPPVLLKFCRSYNCAALSLSSLSSALATYLIYTAGAADAPGVFWLAALPVLMGILLGTPGALAGYILLTLVIAFFGYLKLHNLGPNVIAQHGNYTQEKLFNIITFMIFSGFTTHHYLIGEERLKKNLVEKNMDIENLLRILIHDIANSLSSMTYNLIKAKEDKDKHFPALEMEKIEKALGDINNLLTQVRHLKSVKDGKASLPLKSISLAMVLHEFYENSLTMIQEKGIKVRMDLPDSLYIKTEKTILSGVVLQNILSNAVKFSHAGSFIDIRAYKDDNEAVIEIQDYGIGIPKPILQSLFSVNTHTTRPGTHGEKGTGYGMPLVKEYIHLLGGDIQVESAEPGAPSQINGTKVTLRLPLATN